MALSRGVIGERGSTAKRPLKLQSVLAVALVLTVGVEPKLYYFDNPQKALEALNEEITVEGGNWKRYLELWIDRFPTDVPVLLSTAKIDDDSDTQKGNVIEAINSMKRFGAMYDVRPDIVAVADYPRDTNIMNAINVINEFYHSRSWYDIDASDSSIATSFRKESGSERISMVHSALGTFNPVTNVEEFYDGGVCMAFHRAYLDSKSEYGWFESASNRVINMDSIKYPVDYHEGNDETDPYSGEQIWVFIKDGGIRPWGSDYTCSSDPIWRNGSRVRLVDLAIKAIRKELRDSVDKSLNHLTIVKKTLSAFQNKLIGQGVLLGGTIDLDEDKTTDVEITAGNFYFQFDFQDMPKARKIVVNLNYTDKFSEIAYKLLEEA